MADPSMSSKEGQALVNKLAEVSANMRQAASLADAFAQSIGRVFPGIVVPLQPEAPVPSKKRGRVPKEGKRIKDPNAPKRPPTSYIMFQNDSREELRKQFPDIPYKELLGKISEAWKALPDDRKKAYQDVADANMSKYNRAVIDFKGAVNGHAPAPASSTAQTPEAEEEEEEEEEEEDEEQAAPPPTKRPKAEPIAPPVNASEDSDEASTEEEDSTPPPVALPVKKTKAAAPPSSSKEKKKAKK